MQSLWEITIEDYIEVVNRAKKAGIKEGESMQEIFFEYMREKNQKPIGNTELSQDELLKEVTSHGKNALSIETKDGKTTFKTIKEKEA